MTVLTVSMSATDRCIEAIRRSLPKLPADAREALKQMLSPQSLAILSGGIAVWLASHAVGIGEFVDMLLVGVGFATLGWSVFSGAADLYDFTKTAIGATSDADLDKAANYFAQVVTELGFAAIQALLLRGAKLKVEANKVEYGGSPQFRRILNPGTPPPPGAPPTTVWRTNMLPGTGSTDGYGNIRVARDGATNERMLAVYHESVHRFLSPKAAALRQLRAGLGMSGYDRVAFLRYLEETFAEGFAQLKVYGWLSVVKAVRFSVANGYLTVSQLIFEGSVIGTIWVAGNQFFVSLKSGHPPDDITVY